MFKLNVGVVLGIVLVAAAAWGSPITVNNFSFENPLLVVGGTGVTSVASGLFTGSISGWTTAGGVGTYKLAQVAPTDNFFANVSDATHVSTNSAGVVPSTAGEAQIAFLQSGGTMNLDLGQILGGSLGYSLTMDVGHRFGQTNPSMSYSIMLETSGGTTLATLTGTRDAIDAGFWSQRTLFFSGNDSAFAGQNLRVAISVSGGAGQVNFDNVQVSSGVPEIGGSAIFWTMFGVAGFWIYRKKRLVA
jgi:hypothetical protein